MVNVEPKANNSNLKTEENCISNLSNFSAIFNLQSQNIRYRPLCTLLPEESSWTTLKMKRSQGFYFDKWFIIKRTHNSWFYTQHRNAQDCFCEKGLKSFLIVLTHKESWRNYWTSWLLRSHYFKWCVPAQDEGLSLFPPRASIDILVNWYVGLFQL